jgi:putative inorganic carbon (HCO3(-)) transporter
MFSVITYVLLYYAFVSNFENIIPVSFRPPSWNPKTMIDSRFRGNDKVSQKDQYALFINRLLLTILITGLVVSLYGITEHFGIDKNLWVQDVQNRVFSTLGQPNWLAAYLIALCPIAWGFALIKLENRPSNFYPLPLSSILYLLCSIIFFLTILWTRSRSGFLALAVTDLVFWGIIFLKQRCFVMPDLIRHPLKILHSALDSCFRRNDKGANIARSFLVIHLTFFLIVVINGTYIQQIDNWVTVHAWQQRISRISNRAIEQSNNEKKPEQQQSADQPPQNIPATQSAAPLIESGVTDSGDIRKYVWQGAINAWKSSPKAFLIGTGTETFAFAFYRYKPVGHNLTSEWDFLYNKAHNEYLNFLATTGILGLGTYLLFIGSFMYWFIKSQILPQSSRSARWRSGDLYNKDCFSLDFARDRNDILLIGLFAGWLSILMTNFFGFSVVITQIFLYLYPAIIFALSNQMRDRYFTFSIDWNLKTKKIASASVGVISVLLVFLVFCMWFADKQFATGYHFSRAGYMPQAYQALTSAIGLNPTEPLYHDEQGNVLSALALAAWKENQATMSQELSALSIKENDTALSISPNNVNFWKSRTKIFYTLSAIDPQFLKEAIDALEKGLTLSPLDPKMYYNLAILYGQAGLADKSLELMKKSIELKPNYREGYYGLYVLYNDRGMTQEANQTIRDYLQKVDPKDVEFLKLIQ